MNIIIDKRNHRRRVRRVSLDSLIYEATRWAEREKHPQISVSHGGSVGAAYKYATTTQAAGVVAIPHHGQIHVLAVACDIPATHATISGASLKTLGHRVYDDRHSPARRAAIRSKLLCETAARLALWE